MLTAVEINDLWNQSKNPDDFARAIERAVIKRLGEQEAVFYYRPTSSGGYEGPKWAGSMEKCRIDSGVWRPLYAHPLPAQAVPEGWQPIETMPFNTPVLVSDEKIIASMFFYQRKDRGYENCTYPQFIGAGDAEVRVSLHKNGCYSKLRWWRPMLDIPLYEAPKP